jgi:hypothetical protein
MDSQRTPSIRISALLENGARMPRPCACIGRSEDGVLTRVDPDSDHPTCQALAFGVATPIGTALADAFAWVHHLVRVAPGRAGRRG